MLGLGAYARTYVCIRILVKPGEKRDAGRPRAQTAGPQLFRNPLRQRGTCASSTISSPVPVGLRMTQFSILAALKRFGPLIINALAKKVAMDRPTLTRNIQPLERDSWT